MDESSYDYIKSYNPGCEGCTPDEDGEYIDYCRCLTYEDHATGMDSRSFAQTFVMDNLNSPSYDSHEKKYYHKNISNHEFELKQKQQHELTNRIENVFKKHENTLKNMGGYATADPGYYGQENPHIDFEKYAEDGGRLYLKDMFNDLKKELKN